MLWQVTIGDDIVCLLGDVHFMLLMLAGFGGFKGRVQRAGPGVCMFGLPTGCP